MAASVLYQYPNGFGGTNPPTQAVMALLSLVTVQVVLGDTDTTAAVTHNMQISAADLGSLFPVVRVLASSLGTNPAFITVALTNSNVITLSKISQVGSNGTFNVYVLRPNTLEK